MRSGSQIIALALMTLAAAPAAANTVPPFKGNDTGGIASYHLFAPDQIRDMAANHCASYGKAARIDAVQARYGGYVSFACVWVPPPPMTAILDVRG